jgi:hypothetical protein
MLQKSNRRNFLLPVIVLAIAAASFFIGRYSLAVNKEIISGTIDTAKCGPCMAYNNVKTISKLDVNLLKAMTHNYQLGPNGMINPGNTRSVWLSLEKLKQFIYEVESKTCNCPGSLGVRVYFGNYPADADWINPAGFKDDLNNPSAPDGDFRARVASSGTNLYAGITTIFMVPTIFDGSKNIDFDPADNPNGCNGGYNTEKFIQAAGGVDSFNNPNIYLHKKLGIGVTALSATNHGDACPPLPPGGGGCPAIGSYAAFNH